MKLLLYGATEIGYMIASHLHQQHDITLIHDPGELPDKFTNLDIIFCPGSGADIGILEKVNVSKANLFIACSKLDETNIIACWTVKKVADIETICFIRKVELYRNLSPSNHLQYNNQYDIDSVIWPEQLLTQDIFRIISVPEAIDVEIFAQGKAKLLEYRIKDETSIRNKRVMDCKFPKNVLIVGITRNQQLFIPNGSSEIKIDDKVIFIGIGSALDTLAASFFQQGSKIKTASIIGGGSVGFMLAQMLEEAGIRVKLIEQDSSRCEFLANSLEKTLILHGNGTDIELLQNETIADVDVVVCITDNDEKNLLCSLLIKQLGSERIVTRVGNMQNYELFQRVGIDVVVSPRASALTEVLNRIKAHDIDIVAVIEGGKGEVLGLTLPETFKKTMIKDIHFPANAIIGIISRGRRVIIPDGTTLIQALDRLTIFTMAENVETIKSLFFS